MRGSCSPCANLPKPRSLQCDQPDQARRSRDLGWVPLAGLRRRPVRVQKKLLCGRYEVVPDRFSSTAHDACPHELVNAFDVQQFQCTCITSPNAQSVLSFNLHQMKSTWRLISAELGATTNACTRKSTFSTLLYTFPTSRGQGNSPSIRLGTTSTSIDELL